MTIVGSLLANGGEGGLQQLSVGSAKRAAMTSPTKHFASKRVGSILFSCHTSNRVKKRYCIVKRALPSASMRNREEKSVF